MKTAKQIKHNRLVRKIELAKMMLYLYDGNPYNLRTAREKYDWECRLKHREAMLNHFMSIAHN